MKEANISGPGVANALGVDRAVFHRYVDKQHTPKPPTIERVNRAVAALAAPALRPFTLPDGPNIDVVDRITRYLDAVAACEYGQRDEAAAQGFELAFGFMSSFLSSASVDSAYAAFERSPSEDLGLRLLVELRGVLLDLARSRPSTRSRFDRIVSAFEEEYPELIGRLDPLARMQSMLVHERFHSKIAASIARRLPDRDERLELLGEIEDAVRELLIERDKINLEEQDL
jgi:hypothetical protein